MSAGLYAFCAGTWSGARLLLCPHQLGSVTNAAPQGVIHAFNIVADHVVPHNRGGRTDLENLVTSCPGCNYGKEAFTLEQLGLDDPRARPPVCSGWYGLISLIPGLLRNRQPEPGH